MPTLGPPFGPTPPAPPSNPVLAALRAWPALLPAPPAHRFDEMFTSLHALRDEPYEVTEEPRAAEWTARVEFLALRREVLPGRTPWLLAIDGAFAADLPDRLERAVLEVPASARTEVLLVFLRGGGGDPAAAYLAARLLRGAFAEVRVVVTSALGPAGTIFCLGAAHLHLGAGALLEALDAPARLMSQPMDRWSYAAPPTAGTARSVRAAFDAVRRARAESGSTRESEFLHEFLAAGGLGAEALGVAEARRDRARAFARQLLVAADGNLGAGDERVLAALSLPYADGGTDLDRGALRDAWGPGRVTLGGPAVASAASHFQLFVDGGAPDRMRLTWCTVPAAVSTGGDVGLDPLLLALTARTGSEDLPACPADARLRFARPRIPITTLNDDEIPF